MGKRKVPSLSRIFSVCTTLLCVLFWGVSTSCLFKEWSNAPAQMFGIMTVVMATALVFAQKQMPAEKEEIWEIVSFAVGFIVGIIGNVIVVVLVEGGLEECTKAIGPTVLALVSFWSFYVPLHLLLKSP